MADSTPERIAAAGAISWDLALDLLRAVPASEAASVVASPASMTAALGLSYGRWQEGQCGARIAEVMRFTEIGDAMHNTIGATVAALQSRSLPGTEDADPVVLTLSQSTWAFDTTELPEPTGLAALYGAKPNALLERGEPARALINCIIDAESGGVLPEFLPAGQPAGDTTSYDVNVAVLTAPWAVGMEPRSVAFHLEDGTTDSVEGFGAEVISAQLYQDETLTSVAIPLRGGAVSVMMVIPTADATEGLAPLIDALDGTALRAVRDEAAPTELGFSMPKVAIDSGTLDYNERLGFECEPFTLRSVFHGAVLELDEKGIKAAAATVAEDFEDGGTGAQTVVTVDKPFLFFVHDNATGVVLYSGRYSPGDETR